MEEHERDRSGIRQDPRTEQGHRGGQLQAGRQQQHAWRIRKERLAATKDGQRQPETDSSDVKPDHKLFTGTTCCFGWRKTAPFLKFQ